MPSTRPPIFARLPLLLIVRLPFVDISPLPPLVSLFYKRGGSCSPGGLTTCVLLVEWEVLARDVSSSYNPGGAFLYDAIPDLPRDASLSPSDLLVDILGLLFPAPRFPGPLLDFPPESRAMASACDYAFRRGNLCSLRTSVLPSLKPLLLVVLF